MSESPRRPLDEAGYAVFRLGLASLVADDPELPDIEAVRAFLGQHRAFLGERTAAELDATPDEPLRVMVHYMVLGASDLEPLHGASREWLAGRGFPLPPWDPGAHRVANRLIAYQGKVAAIVEWEPRRAITVDPRLPEPERRWVLAMAIGAGERPQWSDAELERYAAYLTMGEEFAADRGLDDTTLAAKYQVPLEAVRLRRRLPDEIAPGGDEW